MKKCFMAKGGQVEWTKTTKITLDRLCYGMCLGAFVRLNPLDKL